MDERLVVLKGWFIDVLPSPGMGELSFLHVDGDLYESTRDALRLYSRLRVGGAVYIDDYGSFPGCARAVDEYRRAHNITAPMHKIYEAYPPKVDRQPDGSLVVRDRIALDHHERHAGAASCSPRVAFEAVWWIKE